MLDAAPARCPARCVVIGHRRAGIDFAIPTLSLDWKLQLDDGTLYPLGALEIGPVELHVAVTEDDAGALTLEVFAQCPHACGGIDDFAALSNGSVWARAAATIR